MRIHNVTKGDKIKSKIKSSIWIDVDEIFTVNDTVISELTGNEGISFYDRTGSKRVFWNINDYQLISKSN